MRPYAKDETTHSMPNIQTCKRTLGPPEHEMTNGGPTHRTSKGRTQDDQLSPPDNVMNLFEAPLFLHEQAHVRTNICCWRCTYTL